MKRRKIVMMVAVLFVLASAFAFAEYDSDVVKNVMRNNVSLMGELTKAAKQENYFAAGQALMKIAEGAFTVKDFTPARGTKADWEATWEEFIGAAFKGIGACGEEDSKGLDEAINSLKKLNGQGHKAHK